MTGETISRVTTRSRVTDWLATKRPEIAFTSFAFYQNSLAKFLDFLGPKADAPISEVTKADIVAFRNRLLTHVSAKTANHDLRAVKTLFKNAREDDVIAEDPAASVKSAHNKAISPNKRPFTLDELRIVLLGQAGIREKQAHRSRGIGRSVQRQASALSFHSLRRTATTLLHEAGVPAAVVQSLIGHDSEEVHQLYVAVGKDALASAAAKLPDLG